MNHDVATPAPLRKTHPFFWSVRRELWENRSIVVAPAAVGLLALLGFCASTIYVPGRAAALSAEPVEVLADPFRFAARMIVATVFLVGFFYGLDALHGERRDRSILFWKSLPVSDRLTVLSKASIPLAVLPLVAFVTIGLVQLLMVGSGAAIVGARGLGTAALMRAVPTVCEPATLAYELAAMTLWHAPIYGWLLLVSAWARRSMLLWAVMPPVALCLVERIAFGTSTLAPLLAGRFTGHLVRAYTDDRPDPVRFLGTTGLWTGLVVAAIFVAGAVWLRRRRDPI